MAMATAEWPPLATVLRKARQAFLFSTCSAYSKGVAVPPTRSVVRMFRLFTRVAARCPYCTRLRRIPYSWHAMGIFLPPPPLFFPPRSYWRGIIDARMSRPLTYATDALRWSSMRPTRVVAVTPHRGQTVGWGVFARTPARSISSLPQGEAGPIGFTAGIFVSQ